MVRKRQTSVLLGSINTTKLLSLTTAETVYSIESGNRAVEITNLDSYYVYYGDSGVLTNSGGLIFPKGSKLWDHVVDNFTLYLVVATADIANRVVAQEYGPE